MSEVELELKGEHETAFMMIKGWDGNWTASPVMDKPFTIERTATAQDIGEGIKEMADFIDRELLATHIAAKLRDTPSTNPQQA